MMKDIAIIGAGPAGIACAIQLKRFGLNSTVFEKKELGGLIKNANLIENYLGFPNGITGVEYVEIIKKQFEQYNIPVRKEEVLQVKKQGDSFLVNNEYVIDYLVIATGTKPKVLDLEIYSEIKDKVFCEVADMPQIKNEVIAIVGAGDAAFDYALNLSKDNKVKILNRSNRIKALPLLVDRARDNINIDYIEDFQLCRVDNIENEKNKFKLLSQDGVGLEVNYLLCAIGREPNDILLKNYKKELKDDPNLFIIGDVKNGILRQTSVATGDGLKAATEIYELTNRKQ